MWSEPDVVREDLDRIAAAPYLPWDALRGKVVLVTGATGLVGGAVARALLWHSVLTGSGLRVVALVRDRAKAERVFAAPLSAGAPLSFVVGDVADEVHVEHDLDLVVHGASVTTSRDFVTRPVDTIRTAVRGTERLLELAHRHRVASMVYLSSMEVYGAPDGSRRITESDFDCLDPLLVRSSYSEGKRMAECMCGAYAAQHGVPVKVVRLAQTFGPGVARDDGRVYADFARCALEGRDIVLKTTGETERSCLYTADAVTAILTVLLRGQDGSAYNAANESTYLSIRDTAELVARTCASPPVAVRVEPEGGVALGFAPVSKLDLDTSRLQSLGWRPTVGLADMYRRMTAAMDR